MLNGVFESSDRKRLVVRVSILQTFGSQILTLNGVNKSSDCTRLVVRVSIPQTSGRQMLMLNRVNLFAILRPDLSVCRFI